MSQVVGDDLLVTNPVRVAKAIAEKSCNALLLKVRCSMEPSAHTLALSCHTSAHLRHSHTHSHARAIVDTGCVGALRGHARAHVPTYTRPRARYVRTTTTSTSAPTTTTTTTAPTTTTTTTTITVHRVPAPHPAPQVQCTKLYDAACALQALVWCGVDSRCLCRARVPCSPVPR